MDCVAGHRATGYAIHMTPHFFPGHATNRLPGAQLAHTQIYILRAWHNSVTFGSKLILANLDNQNAFGSVRCHLDLKESLCQLKKNCNMKNFSERFQIIYGKFKEDAEARKQSSKKNDLMRFLGISQGRMQGWERGGIPKALDCLQIHDRLGFKLRWLISGEGPLFSEDSHTVITGEQDLLKENRELSRQVIDLYHENRQLRIAISELQKAAEQKDYLPIIKRLEQLEESLAGLDSSAESSPDPTPPVATGDHAAS